MRIYSPRSLVIQNMAIAVMLTPAAAFLRGDRAYHIESEAFEHIGFGVQVRPQTSAGLDMNGPVASVVDAGVCADAALSREAAPVGPFTPLRRVV